MYKALFWQVIAYKNMYGAYITNYLIAMALREENNVTLRAIIRGHMYSVN